MPESLLSWPLIGARAVHFAATVLLVGVVLFVAFVEEPTLRKVRDQPPPAIAALRHRLLAIAWFSLAVSVASAAAWLVALAARITGSSLAQAIAGGAAQVLLARTQFGHDWQARLVLAVLLAAALLWFGRQARWGPAERFAAAAIAMSFLGTLTWSGHGGATPGVRGEVHAAADVLHLVAAGAWIGGLLPLRLLLASAERAPAAVGLAVAHDATLRFSTLGIAAVATLAATGLVNAWVLVDGFATLVDSQYGRLLVLKVAIFLATLAVAAFNRVRLTPRLAAAASGDEACIDALRRLERNCLVETALGLSVIVVVAVLGTIPPAMAMPM